MSSGIFDEVWAIIPEWLTNAVALMESGQPRAQGAKPGARQESNIAVLPIRGPISRRPNFFTMMFGGVTTEELSMQLRGLAANDMVKRIVLDIDSPGGSVPGLTELAKEIRDIRAQKPVTAVANTLMASAAYWLGAQANEVVASPSAEVGSIGMFALHFDHSRELDNLGVKPTFIQFGERKTEGNPLEPLSDRARERAQEVVDQFGHSFIRDVAAGRRISQATVMSDFGQGLVFTAAEALQMGLVDRIATLDDVLAGYGMADRRAALKRDIARAGLTNS